TIAVKKPSSISRSMQSCGTLSEARKPSRESSSASDRGSSRARISAMGSFRCGGHVNSHVFAGRQGYRSCEYAIRAGCNSAAAPGHRDSAQRVGNVEREREREKRAGLMKRGDRKRHDIEQCRDAERDL